MPAEPRRARKRDQTRDRIAETAHRLFERDGYDAITMEQIAAEADVARGTLYNHFPVKEAVLVHWMHAQFERDRPTAPPAQAGFAGQMSALLRGAALWWEANRQYAAPYLRYRFQQAGPRREGEASSGAIAVYARLIEQAQQRGELSRDRPAERLAHYFHYLYLSALMAWLGDPESALQDGLAEAFEFFLAGAAA
ncbi:TetR/AcrR family transcriptional regulator [Lysobacter sp. BMK333-48F3]|uniref:TetR/AcrR family transcriptional regulator n=1 Tax=Lysobacter sp. BMK333-48F3 TaxID=2867962 RepID=UPI001C8CC11E|nr:TetR/AcrR family transcriptional regulator [Lysobacter sp. BMK333-48F3]MBX9400314.1 TetR/AcrR family transcriptional regulator [Lysobacter sp. BMK333-48F3]